METKSQMKKIIADIDAKWGTGSIMALSKNMNTKLDVISSGSLSLDVALGGGYGRGKIVEIYGQPAMGKSSLALHAIVEAQKRGEKCAFIDMEQEMNMDYAQTLGIETSKLLISQPDTAEQALDIIETLINSGEVALIVLDSIAALVPRAEVEGEMGDSHMGLAARLIGQALRKIKPGCNSKRVTLIAINQLRQTLNAYYTQNVTPGGKALKYYAAQRIELKKDSFIGAKDKPDGIKLKAYITKNKLFPPFKTALFSIYFGKGIEPVADVVNACILKGAIKKSGAVYTYEDKAIRGVEELIKYFRENTEEFNKLKSILIKK